MLPMIGLARYYQRVSQDRYDLKQRRESVEKAHTRAEQSPFMSRGYLIGVVVVVTIAAVVAYSVVW